MWGFNSNGELGDNTIIHRSSPVQTVAGGSNWSQIATSRIATYGLKTDGTLWSWGRNAFSALGDNTTISRSSPVQTISGGTNWSSVSAIPSGNFQAFLGALIFGITGIGLGWVNCAADYSRYLPRSVSSRGVIGWTVFGASIVPIILVIYGSMLAGSSKELSDKIAMDPIGALTTLVPTWYLIPFAAVAILGLIGGAILDLYSSGLALISVGLPVKRHVAASIDAVIMALGTIYIVWIAGDFFGPFQGFLITLGVPIAAWSAIFVADVVMRKRDYKEADLFNPKGIYGSWNLRSLSLVAIGALVGWGFVTNTFASWLSWQGYFLGLIGGKDGPWAYSNIGVILALAIGFFGHILLSRKIIANQEK
jgi:purine-cytosine permease-like protein